MPFEASRALHKGYISRWRQRGMRNTNIGYSKRDTSCSYIYSIIFHTKLKGTWTKLYTLYTMNGSCFHAFLCSCQLSGWACRWPNFSSPLTNDLVMFYATAMSAQTWFFDVELCIHQHAHVFILIFHRWMYIYMIIYIYNNFKVLPIVPHKAVAEVSKIGNLQERLVVVTHGWQSESTDGPKGGWSCVFWNGCNGCRGHLTTTAGCSVV